jgi:hypothetical protein
VEEFCSFARHSTDPKWKVKLSEIYIFYEKFWKEWSGHMYEEPDEEVLKDAIVEVRDVMRPLAMGY